MIGRGGWGRGGAKKGSWGGRGFYSSADTRRFFAKIVPIITEQSRRYQTPTALNGFGDSCALTRDIYSVVNASVRASTTKTCRDGTRTMWTQNIHRKFDGYVIYLVESDVSALAHRCTKAKSTFVSLISNGSSRTTGSNVDSVSWDGSSLWPRARRHSSIT